ncbi:MAG TPA: hypothetical protein VNU45_18065 [Rummeliibacillus sp.]|nr:hypothetical protein [Rummeliibacillus sp.]
MNKQEYLSALNELITKANERSWEENQEKMIEDFRIQEEERLELFNKDENVGYQEELLLSAQRFQGNWAYEKNRHLSPIF